MKTIKLEAKELVNALTVLNKLDVRSSGESELVFFKIYNGMVDVFGLGEDVEVRVKLNVNDVDNVGSCNIAVNKKSMLDIVGRIGKESEYVLIAMDNYSVTVKGDNGAFSLKPLKCARVIPSISGNIYLEDIYAKNLTGALSSVIHASPSGSGVVYIDDGCVYVCGDYRFAMHRIKLHGVSQTICISVDVAKFIVDTLNMLGEEIVKVRYIDGVIIVKVGGFILRVKCGEPILNWALDSNYKIVVFVNKMSFIDALRQMEAKYVYVEANSEKFNLPSMYLSAIRLRSCDENGDLGLPVKLNAKYENTGWFKGVFNVQHLIESIEPVRDDTVALYCPEGGEDNWIRICNGSGDSYLAVIRGMILE